MNFCYLVFCGNMPLEPSWHILENLSDSEEKDVRGYAGIAIVSRLFENLYG
jgi:hypothetical protein